MQPAPPRTRRPTGGKSTSRPRLRSRAQRLADRAAAASSPSPPSSTTSSASPGPSSSATSRDAADTALLDSTSSKHSTSSTDSDKVIGQILPRHLRRKRRQSGGAYAPRLERITPGGSAGTAGPGLTARPVAMSARAATTDPSSSMSRPPKMGGRRRSSVSGASALSSRKARSRRRKKRANRFTWNAAEVASMAATGQKLAILPGLLEDEYARDLDELRKKQALAKDQEDDSALQPSLDRLMASPGRRLPSDVASVVKPTTSNGIAVFVKPSHNVPSSGQQVQSARMAPRPRRRSDKKRQAELINAEERRMVRQYPVGCQVNINNREGQVFFVGQLSFQDGVWLGVKLVVPHGHELPVVEVSMREIKRKAGKDLAKVLGDVAPDRAYFARVSHSIVIRHASRALRALKRSLRFAQATARINTIMRQNREKKVLGTSAMRRMELGVSEGGPYVAVDLLSLEAPEAKTKTVAEAVAYLTGTLLTRKPLFKIRAIFRWISGHVRMLDPASTEASFAFKDAAPAEVRRQLASPTRAFEKRTASPEGIARLLHHMLGAAGFVSVVVSGHAKNGDRVQLGHGFSDSLAAAATDGTLHHWVAVRWRQDTLGADSGASTHEWGLFDLAWAMGQPNPTGRASFSSCFFNTPAHSFFLQHFPLKVEGDPSVDSSVADLMANPALAQFPRPRRGLPDPKPRSLEDFAKAVLVSQAYVEYGVECLHPTQQFVKSSTPYYTITLEAPARFEYAVEVRPKRDRRRSGSPIDYHEEMRACWHCQVLDSDEDGRAETRVYLVFPRRGEYVVVVTCKPFTQTVDSFAELVRFEIACRTGVEDIPARVGESQLFLGYISRRRMHARDNDIEARIRFIEPFKGYFRLGEKFSLAVAVPKSIDDLIFVNNGRWKRIPIDKKEPARSGTRGSEPVVVRRTQVTLRKFPEILVFYRKGNSFQLLYTFMSDAKLDEELEDDRLVGASTPPASASPSPSPPSVPLTPPPRVITPSCLTLDGRVLLDTHGRCFQHCIRLLSANAGRNSVVLELQSVDDPELGLQGVVLEGWGSSGTVVPANVVVKRIQKGGKTTTPQANRKRRKSHDNTPGSLTLPSVSGSRSLPPSPLPSPTSGRSPSPSPASATAPETPTSPRSREPMHWRVEAPVPGPGRYRVHVRVKTASQSIFRFVLGYYTEVVP